MSGDKKNRNRLPNDSYQTPGALAYAIAARLNSTLSQPPRRVVEPSAGRGAFVAAAHELWPKANILAVDIDPQCEGWCLKSGADRFVPGDFAKLAVDGVLGVADLVLGNPPFTYAEDHIRAIWNRLLPGASLAFLLRLNFLGSRARVDFFRALPLKMVAPIIPRPGFLTKSGSDTTEYGMFLWQKDYVDNTILAEPIIWKT